jgi:hypothetical protein
MGQTHGQQTDGSSAYAGRQQGPDDHEAEQQAVQSALEAFQERTGGQSTADIETPDEDEPQPWHESFTSREGIGGMLDDLPATESGDPADSQEALSDSYNQFFGRMDEMSAAASEAAEAQGEALGRSQQQREAARPYDNDDIRRDKTGISATEQRRRNAEEHRIRRGTDVAGPHSVPWEQEAGGPPQNRTLQQQESIEADAAELNDISEQAHQGIDHNERGAAVRTASSDRTAPADTALDSITVENPRDGSGYEVPVETGGEWASDLAESHDQDTVDEVADLSQEITGAFPENATEADLDPSQFTAGPSQEAVANGISTLMREEDQSPQQAAYNVVDTLEYDEQTRHALDESALDPRDTLDETQQQRAENAAQDLQETYPHFSDQDADRIEQTIAQEMAAGADVISAQSSTVHDAAENDTFTWPIEELDVESQHRATVEGNIEELYDPNDAGQHQTGILKDMDAPTTPENHMKVTWFKNSGIDGKVSNLAGEADAEGAPPDEVDVSGSRDYLREGDRVRFVRGTVDRWKDQKQLAVRGITEIQILEEGDGPVMYEGMGEPPDTTSTPQNLDTLSSDREEVDPGDFDDTESYMEALSPDPEEQRPDGADTVTAARDVVPASDAAADLDMRDGVERVENDGETQFEITTESRGDVPSNPWRAQEQRERRREGRLERQYDEQSEEYRRRSLERWDVPDDAVDRIIEQERQEQVEREVSQSMSYQRSQSETQFGYDSNQVHLDLPTDSERRK